MIEINEEANVQGPILFTPYVFSREIGHRRILYKE